MNWEELRHDWKGKNVLLKTYWQKLTDADLETVDGCREKLAATLQRLYGFGEAEAEEAVASFEKEVRFSGAVK